MRLPVPGAAAEESPTTWQPQDVSALRCFGAPCWALILILTTTQLSSSGGMGCTVQLAVIAAGCNAVRQAYQLHLRGGGGIPLGNPTEGEGPDMSRTIKSGYLSSRQSTKMIVIFMNSTCVHLFMHNLRAGI